MSVLVNGLSNSIVSPFVGMLSLVDLNSKGDIVITEELNISYPLN